MQIEEAGLEHRAAPLARGAALQVEEIRRPAQLEALTPEWSALFADCPQASPFQSPQWLLPWRRRFLGDGLWTLAVRRAGRLVGLAPLFIYESRSGGRQLTLIGNGLSDRLDLLARSADADAAAEAVMGHLANRSDLWDCCDFRDLPAGSPLVSAALPSRPAMDVLSPDAPCPVIRLPPEPDAILRALPKSRRADLRRCARRLGELGPVRFETATSASRAEHLTALVRLHGARWSLRGEPGVLAEADVVAFHDEATAGLLGAGMLRLQVLRLGERIIAAHYGLRRGERGFSYLHAFDPDFAAYGPGWLLMLHVLEAAVAEGARVFDFLRGREAYKHAWGGADQPQFRRRIRR